jgi:peptidoglycan/LPS O-acetylase OafA/YrhL
MIKPLTSLRFFFALMVFGCHLYIFGRSDSEFLKTFYISVLTEGRLGVSFFFILSGFILAYNYQEALINGQKTRYDFYLARFARIYPLHVLCFFIWIPLAYKEIFQTPLASLLNAASNLTLTQSFIPKEPVYFSFNLPSWSISDEMFFYLMFPLIIGTFRFFNRSKTALLYIAGTVLFIGLMLFVIPSTYYHDIFYINPLIRITDFIIGIALYNLYVTISKKHGSISAGWEYLSIAVFVLFFVFRSYIPGVLRYSVYYWIPMSLIIFSFAFQKGLLSKLLSNKTLVLFGEISFGFYMFHYIILRYLIFINKHILKFDSELYIAPVAFILTILISYLSFKWFETPLNKYIKGKFGRARAN